MESSQIVQSISQSVFGLSGNQAEETAPVSIELDAFEKALENMGASDISNRSNDVVKVSAPVSSPQDSSSLSIGEQLQKGVASIDTEFRGTMGRLEEWPTFKNYLERFDTSLEKSISLDPDSNTRHVSNIERNNDLLDVDGENTSLSNSDSETNPLVEKYEDMHNVTRTYYSAAAQYNTESTMWFLKAEFWMTKVKVVTSAMSSVSQGVKTLFTSA